MASTKQPRAIGCAAILRIAALAASCVASTTALAAGYATIEIPADASGPAIRASVWSPCAQAPLEVVRGPFRFPARADCPVQGDRLPLVVLSHGYGGNQFGHVDTALALADAGFVVVALNHPDDTTFNRDPVANAMALVSRPTDVKRTIDHMLGAWPQAARLDPRRIGFFGFSRGGYTGLVVAGAQPDVTRSRVRCPERRAPLCADPQSMHWTHDARVRAMVIADPLSLFPTRDSLKAVTVPIQLWSSERGGDGVLPEDVASIARELPVRPDFRVVRDTAHFAFLAPCPPGLRQEVPQICIDAGGFDRVAFHSRFDAEVVEFLRAKLPP